MSTEQKNRNREQASRMMHLRNAVFRTEGFGSNEPIPSVSKALGMHGRNQRAMAAQRPQPSFRG